MSRTDSELDAIAKELKRFHYFLEQAAERIRKMYGSKAKDYNKDGQEFWHYMVHGDLSWSHEVAKNAMRLVSMVKNEQQGHTSEFEGIDEKILDTMVYCAAWWADRQNRKDREHLVEGMPDATFDTRSNVATRQVHELDRLSPRPVTSDPD